MIIFIYLFLISLNNIMLYYLKIYSNSKNYYIIYSLFILLLIENYKYLILIYLNYFCF